MRQTVVGVFDRYANAQHAAQQLRESGFGDSVYVTEDLDAGADTTSASTASTRDDTGVFAHVRNFFAELFGAEDEREVGPYAEAVRRGGAIVKVEVEEEAQADAARSALEAAGAIDIDEKVGEWRASGWDEGTGVRGSTASGDEAGLSAAGSAGLAGSSEKTVLSGTSSMSDTEYIPPQQAERARTDEDVIPVLREELQVGKRRVATGGVRVYARTVETPVQESLELRSERAEVERTPVDRPATAADLDALGERTIEVRETAERPVVAKEARVVEEVRVGKTVETHMEDVSDSVRRTEVEVENLAGSTGSRAAGSDLGADDDADYFRSHWQSTYADDGSRWEDYEPAYRYGSTMRSDSRYSGRDWDTIEPDLRSDWETRHGDSTGGTWERFKAAVRHGWDRMTN